MATENMMDEPNLFRQKVKNWIGELSKVDSDVEIRFHDANGNEYYVVSKGEKYLHRGQNFLSLKVQRCEGKGV